MNHSVTLVPPQVKGQAGRGNMASGGNKADECWRGQPATLWMGRVEGRSSTLNV